MVASNRGGAGTAADDPGVVHVHGLGVNPKDGSLFVATHTGLFRIDGGRASRVGGSYQDTMGFTVAGPDHFLGGGHPDPRDKDLQVPGKRPMLGLVESRDAGMTWTSLSLLGDADFHGLAHAHGSIYAYDVVSSRFMVSRDGREWDVRSTAQLQAFAVSPEDPGVIVGSTTDSTVRSTDGGRTWTPASVPSFIALSWPEARTLFGARPTGDIMMSADGGVTWSRSGSLSGVPDAIFAQGDTVFVSIHQDGIYRSNDRGRSFELYYRDPRHRARTA